MTTILIAAAITLCVAIVIYIGTVVSNWLDFNSVPARVHYVYLTYAQLINYLPNTSCTLNYDNRNAWFEMNKYPGNIRIKMPFFSYLIFADRIKEINKSKYKISYDKLMVDYTMPSEDTTNENH